jgi:DNA-binding transcriptional LysR family regulator
MGRWQGIEEYISVVEAGSFTAAAERLGVSKSYISKQVKHLEDRMRVRLLQRTRRKLTLSEIGEVFYRHCKEMEAQVEQAESRLSELQQTPMGTLKVAINSRYGTEYMAGAVAAFARQYPDLAVAVHSTFRDVDLVDEGYDLTVRFDKLEDSSMIARNLGGFLLGLFASPEYWEAHGEPQNLDELVEHNCLTTPDGYWLFDSTDQSGKCIKMRVLGNWTSEDGANLLVAAKAGIGIAQLPDFYVQHAVHAGELIKLAAPSWSHYHRDVWVVYPHARHLSTKVRLFIDFLVEYLRSLHRDDFGFPPV